MKTTKRNIFLLLLATTISTAILGFTEIGETNKEIVTVRTTESVGGYDSSIITVYPNGELDKIELEKLNYKNISTNNLLTINGHLNSIILKGYSLNSVSSGASQGALVTTYTFTRE